ncbi:MAG: asparaginase [Rhizobiales bacterium]|nr:asparaginase [Hyphomicrobiales bacterium]
MALVEVTRGGIVESAHAGRLVVARSSGEVLLSFGDVNGPVFPRSAIKLIQALPLVESGAADAFRFDARALALATASHGGEPRHATCAATMLAAAGAGPEALECGAHMPTTPSAAKALRAAGERCTALHNNCSGKHAGMIATARHLGEVHSGYVERDHAVQQRIRSTFEEVCDVDLAAAPVGVDGCSVPTWAMPLRSLATGFARLSDGRGLGAVRLAAAARLIAAGLAEPAYVAGEGRFCTGVMELLAGAAYVKTGAEGVFCGLLPDRGIAIALKVDDGATRASEVAMAAVLAALLPNERTRLARYTQLRLTNWTGRDVGEIRPSAALNQALSGL